MRLGAIVLQTRPWRELGAVFRSVEDVGFDVAYVADHLTHPSIAGRWLGDAWVTLAATASVTSRLDLGTLVASAAYRGPVPLARAAATLDDVLGDRFVLGLGAGSPFCAAADRGAHPTAREMADRFTDVVEGLTHVWDGATEWSGRSLGFEGVETLATPPGRTRPRLMLAAHGPRGFELVARHADAWSSYGGPASVGLDPDDYWRLVNRQSSAVSRACEVSGRDPDGLRRSLLLGFGTIRPLDGAAQLQECCERAERAGFDELVVYWPDGEPGSRFWADPDVVLDAVAAARRS